YRDLEPPLAFVYASSSGNGWLGVGWNLAGLSFIQRTSSGRGVPSYRDDDRFFLDGMELMSCTPSMQSPSCLYPASSGHRTYTTRIETFQRIAYDPAVDCWYVWTKTGAKLT